MKAEKLTLGSKTAVHDQEFFCVSHSLTLNLAIQISLILPSNIKQFSSLVYTCPNQVYFHLVTLPCKPFPEMQFTDFLLFTITKEIIPIAFLALFYLFLLTLFSPFLLTQLPKSIYSFIHSSIYLSHCCPTSSFSILLICFHFLYLYFPFISFGMIVNS